MTEQATEATTACAPSSIEFAALPAVGSDLAGGRFAGVTTATNGAHCAVILLTGQAKDIGWQDAKTWAAEQGGELPSRPVAALLYTHSMPLLLQHWHWTSKECEFDASYAWYCAFGDGHQGNAHKSCCGCAVAVRLIPLES